VIEKCCAAAFFGGLVHPKPVSSASGCPVGVARIETSRSFSNLVWTLLTVGIYSPMSLRITCAGSSAIRPTAPPPPEPPPPPMPPGPAAARDPIRRPIP
jgi:hypothetical protein